MEELERLLGLLHGARDRWRTARGVMTYTVDVRLAERARERWEDERRRGGDRLGTAYASMVAFGPGGEAPGRMRSTTRFWHEPPGRMREEVEVGEPAVLEHAVVRDGEDWWTYSPGWGVVTSTAGDDVDGETVNVGGGEQSRALLDPSALLPLFDFEVLGEAEAAGRAALRVRARPRSGLGGESSFFRAHLPPGANAHELLVDRERGVVLRAGSFLDGEEFAASEIVGLAFDEDFPPGTFVFEPPEGEAVRGPLEHPFESVPIEEAARRASFPVFAPGDLGDGVWTMHVTYVEPRDRPAMQESVFVSCHRADGRHSLSLSQRPAGTRFEWAGYEDAGFELERVERDGLELVLYRPPRRHGGTPTVVHERDGTVLELTSHDLGEERLVALAAGLERIEVQPPSPLG